MIKNDLSSRVPSRLAPSGLALSGLSAPDRTVLAHWCRSRRMGIGPSRTGHEIMLTPKLPRSGWRFVTLSKRRGVYCLDDEWGDALAEASSLQMVLDALDGGVAGSVWLAPLAQSPLAPSPLAQSGSGRSFAFV